MDQKMKIDCIGCLHGYIPKLEGGDVLIITGDLTARDTDEEHRDFIISLIQIQHSDKKYKKIIYIAGNHDNFLYEKSRHGALKTSKEWNIEYLCDSGIEFEGLKIWGTPWTNSFEGINPHCTAFTANTDIELKEKFDLIPDDIDILISHGPAWTLLDQVNDYENGKVINTGSRSLLKALDRVKPLYMVFSHIHEKGGDIVRYKHIGKDTICLNVSHVDETYKPRKEIRTIRIENGICSS